MMKTGPKRLAALAGRAALEEGYSLTEVLVAMVIFVLVVVSFGALFTNSYRSVTVAGQRSRALSELQGEAEHPGRASQVEDTLDINFPGISITAEGKIIPLEKEYGEGRKVSVTYFIPAR